MSQRRSPQPALSWSLRAGAVYDLLFGFLLVAFPAFASGLFGLPLPGERFYLWLIALFLSSLAVFYILVARDPARNPEFVRLAIGIRFAGAAVLGAAGAGRPDLHGLYLVAGADLLFGLAHLAWSRSSGANPARPA